MNSNKNKIKSEILVQDKFLEYNDNMDDIIRGLDKNIMNADEFIAGRNLTFFYNKFFRKKYFEIRKTLAKGF